jgi:hypothetical protein
MTVTRLFVGFRLAAESLAKVDDLAKQRGTDRSEALRYLLARGWRAHEATPEQPSPVKQTEAPVKHGTGAVDESAEFTERHRRLQKTRRG